MCELFGVSAKRKVKLNQALREFFNHSEEHPNGWGMAKLDECPVELEREPLRAKDSKYLRQLLGNRIESARLMAHIRKATVGEICKENCHPFVRTDGSGRTWVLMHNGTLFDAPRLNRYIGEQDGKTDSERILMYIMDHMNRNLEEDFGSFDANDRFNVIDRAIQRITPGNKVNLMIYDGDYFYVHKNQEGTLYMKEEKGATYFSTRPLDDGPWKDFPMNQLHVFKDGELIYVGTKHENTYVFDPEQFKFHFMEFAGL